MEGKSYQKWKGWKKDTQIFSPLPSFRSNHFISFLSLIPSKDVIQTYTNFSDSLVNSSNILAIFDFLRNPIRYFTQLYIELYT